MKKYIILKKCALITRNFGQTKYFTRYEAEQAMAKFEARGEKGLFIKAINVKRK